MPLKIPHNGSWMPHPDWIYVSGRWLLSLIDFLMWFLRASHKMSPYIQSNSVLSCGMYVFFFFVHHFRQISFHTPFSHCALAKLSSHKPYEMLFSATTVPNFIPPQCSARSTDFIAWHFASWVLLKRNLKNKKIFPQTNMTFMMLSSSMMDLPCFSQGEEYLLRTPLYTHPFKKEVST